MLTLVLLAQITNYPTAAPASRPVELQTAEPVRAKTLSEIVAGKKGGLVLPTVVPAVKTPTPQPLPAVQLPPASAPLSQPAPRPTVARDVAPPPPPPPPKAEERRFPVLAVAGVALLVFVSGLVFLRRRSAKGSSPVAGKQTSAVRPATSSPATGPRARTARPVARPECEWRWGGTVGPAEELEVVGARFQRRFLRRWGGPREEELEATGDATVRASADELAVRITGGDARSGSFDAWLKPEPGHTHDARIVAVVAVVRPDFIETVGYLPKADAERWQPLLLELERRGGVGFLAQGRVVRSRKEGGAPSVLIVGGVGPLEETLAAVPAPVGTRPAPRGSAGRGPVSR